MALKDTPWGLHLTACFDSLQTGKCIPSHLGSDWEFNRCMFRFPSNGKVYSKSSSARGLAELFEFRFPSNEKADYKVKSPLSNRTSLEFCFDSLQTGTRITRTITSLCWTVIKSPFPFPSNGKTYYKYNGRIWDIQ